MVCGRVRAVEGWPVCEAERKQLWIVCGATGPALDGTATPNTTRSIAAQAAARGLTLPVRRMRRPPFAHSRPRSAGMEVGDVRQSRNTAKSQPSAWRKYGPGSARRRAPRLGCCLALQRQPTRIHAVVPANPPARTVLPLANGAGRRARMRLAYGHRGSECRRGAGIMSIG
jgi:hypothetical protein